MFAHDTVSGLVSAADLVNTGARGAELLADLAALAAFLDRHEITGQRTGTVEEWRDMLAVRPQLRAVWEARSPAAAAEVVNAQLLEAEARPRLTDHDGLGWHFHAADPTAPLARRFTAAAAMAFADLIRLGELSRLRVCAAEDCDAVLVDLSRNRSRRFCDIGNCANREHVAAYRARRRALGAAAPTASLPQHR
jgi:predicted RNA-binding Zn ribbon-like protein